MIDALAHISSPRLAVSVGHDDLSWSPETQWGGASNFFTLAFLGCLSVLVLHRLVAHVVTWRGWPSSEQEPLIKMWKSSKKGGAPDWAQELALFLIAAVLFTIAGREASERGAPKHAAYPNLYATLQFTHAYASLGYAWLLLLCWALGGIPAIHRYVRRLRPLILFLWLAWVALFPLMRLSLHNLPYAGFWVTDCSEVALADSTRLEASRAKLDQLTSKLQTATKPNVILAEPWLCVAVLTTPRAQQYLTQSIGSLLGGLSDEELSQLRVKIVSSVPVHRSDELEALVGSDGHRLRPVLEVVDGTMHDSSTNSSWKIEENRNYVAGLDACSREGLPYVLAIEDDAIATQSLVSKLSLAIEAVTASSKDQWRVLKLFQTEFWHGHWDVDFGSLMCLLVVPGVFGGLFAGFVMLLWQPKTGRYLAFVIAFIFATSIASFGAWAIGRANLLQVFPHGASRHAQPDALCASTVADVYPLGVVDRLAEWIKADMHRPTDLAVCDFATKADGPGDRAQWLYSPSLFQHVGSFSSNLAKNQGACVYSKSSMTWRA